MTDFTTSKDQHPRVLVSYVHTNNLFDECISRWCSMLMNMGIEVIVDLWLPLGTNLEKFIFDVCTCGKIDYVLCICNQKYADVIKQDLADFSTDGLYLNEQMLKKVGDANIIPIELEGEYGQDNYIPSFLRKYRKFSLNIESEQDSLSSLARQMWGFVQKPQRFASPTVNSSFSNFQQTVNSPIPPARSISTYQNGNQFQSAQTSNFNSNTDFDLFDFNEPHNEFQPARNAEIRNSQPTNIWSSSNNFNRSEELELTFINSKHHGPLKALEGGSYYMGSPRSELERSEDEEYKLVHVDKFYIGVYPVRVKEYLLFLNECDDFNDLWVDLSVQINRNDRGSFYSNPEWADHPITCVSFHGAKAYTTWLSHVCSHNYYIPSEVEWEYACRAGTITRYYWGEDLNNELLTKVTNSCGIIGTSTPVGSYPPNPWGLYDMCGNVQEWTSTLKNGKNYILRGGSWHSSKSSPRSALRHWLSPSMNCDFIGFRIACK
mgnify:CR=1 FL=1